MKKNTLNRQQRQLRAAVTNFKNALRRRGRRSQQEIINLIRKIKRLSKQLVPQIGQLKLAKMLGITAIYLGSSFMQQLSAQVTFAPAVQNPFGFTIPNNGDEDQYTLPTFGDLDGDGDFDMLAGDYGRVLYYENVGTISAPDFQAPVVSPFGINVPNDYAILPQLVDIDTDGDLDMVISTGDETGVLLLKNIGTATEPQFAAPDVGPFETTTGFYYVIPTFADIDGDGDMDLLGGEYEVGFAFYENTGTAEMPAFGPVQINPFGLDLPPDDEYLVIPSFVDLDNDGDFDIFIGVYDGNMEYFENTGTATEPMFGSGVEMPFELPSANQFAFPAFVDIDNDGDQDLFIGEYYANVQYFENTTIVSSLEGLPDDFPLEVFPNPMQDRLTIKTSADLASVELFNALGQRVLLVKGADKNISLPALIKGFYEVKITLVDGKFLVKKLIKD